MAKGCETSRCPVWRHSFTCLKQISFKRSLLLQSVAERSFASDLSTDFQDFTNLDHISTYQAVCSRWTVPNFLLCYGKVAAANLWTFCCRSPTPAAQYPPWVVETRNTHRIKPTKLLYNSLLLPSWRHPAFSWLLLCAELMTSATTKTLCWAVTAICA